MLGDSKTEISLQTDLCFRCHNQDHAWVINGNKCILGSPLQMRFCLGHYIKIFNGPSYSYYPYYEGRENHKLYRPNVGNNLTVKSSYILFG